MRKFISTLLAGIVLCGFGVGLTGCTDESKVETATKVTSPDGTAKETHLDKIETSGAKPPALPSDKK